MRVIRKPIPMEAWQYKGDVPKDTPDWVIDATEPVVAGFTSPVLVGLVLLCGKAMLRLSLNDWLIKETSGDIHIVKPGVFQFNYEEAL